MLRAFGKALAGCNPSARIPANKAMRLPFRMGASHSSTSAGKLTPDLLMCLSLMKNFSFAQRGIACACALACASLTSASVAQSSPELKPIIVNANRTEQLLQSAPVGASVILGDEIRASGALDANEAVRRLGGVASRADLLGGREASLDLRGFGDSAANNMVVVIDGIRISENELASARLSAIGADRIERIEIVRGGASVAWGEGATAGVINVITKSGAKKGLSGTAQVSLESFGMRDASANLDVGADNARFFANLRNFNTDGYRNNSGQRSDSLSLGMEAGSAQGLKLRLEFSSNSTGSRLPGALPVAKAEINPKQTNTPLDFASRREDRTSVALQYRSGGWLASLDVAQRDRSAKMFNDYGVGGTQDTASTSQGTQVSPRLQYTGELGGAAVTALLGIDRQRWQYQNDVAYSGFAANAETAQQSNRASFVRADVLLPTATRLVLGARSERIAQSFDDSLAAVNYQTHTPLKAWELGLNQTVASGLDVYGRAAKSYRIANVDENRYLATPLMPQTTRDVELGLRHASKQGSYALRAFRQSTQNEIAYDNNLFSNVNLDPVRRTGIELEGQIQLHPAWRLSGSVQNIKARFSSGAYTGKRPPHVAEMNAQARLAWSPAAAHRIEAALNHRGEAVLGNDWNNACTRRAPARTTLDLNYAFSPAAAPWSLSAGVDNLVNSKTFGWGFTNATCSATNVYPEAGRSFKLKARYSF